MPIAIIIASALAATTPQQCHDEYVACNARAIDAPKSEYNDRKRECVRRFIQCVQVKQ